MKKFYQKISGLVALLLFWGAQSIFAQSSYSPPGTVTIDWASIPWVGGSPTATSVVTINPSGTNPIVTINNMPTTAFASLIFQGSANATLNFNAATAQTLTISTNISSTIGGSRHITFNSNLLVQSETSGVLSMPNASANQLNFNGGFRVQGGGTAVMLNNAITIAGNPLTINGDLSIGSTGVVSQNSNVNLGAGSNFTINGNFIQNASSTLTTVLTSTLTLATGGLWLSTGPNTLAANTIASIGGTYRHNKDGAALPVPNAPGWTATSSCELLGVTSNIPANLNNQNFGNLTWNCPGQLANYTWNITTGFGVQGTLSIVSTNGTNSAGLNGNQHQGIVLAGSGTPASSTFSIGGITMSNVNSSFALNNSSNTQTFNIGSGGITVNANEAAFSCAYNGTTTVNVTGNLSFPSARPLFRVLDPGTNSNCTATLNCFGNFSFTSGGGGGMQVLRYNPVGFGGNNNRANLNVGTFSAPSTFTFGGTNTLFVGLSTTNLAIANNVVDIRVNGNFVLTSNNASHRGIDVTNSNTTNCRFGLQVLKTSGDINGNFNWSTGGISLNATPNSVTATGNRAGVVVEGNFNFSSGNISTGAFDKERNAAQIRFTGSSATYSQTGGGNYGGVLGLTFAKDAGETLTLNSNLTCASVVTARNVIDSLSGGTVELGNFTFTIGAQNEFYRSNGSFTAGGTGFVTTAPAAYYLVYGATLTTGLEVVTATNRIHTVTVDPGAGNTVTCGSNIGINTSLLVNSGTLDVGTFSVNRIGAPAGPFSLATGATIILGGTNGIPASYNTYTFNGTVVLNGAAQSVGGFNYNNLTLGGTADKTLIGAANVSGALLLDGRRISLGNNELTLTPTGTIGVVSGSFGSSQMVITNGIGRLTFQGNTTSSLSGRTFPVGTGTTYTPVVTSGGTGTLAATPGSLSVGSVATVHPTVVVPTTALSRYFRVQSSNFGASQTISFSFTYGAGETNGSVPAYVVRAWNTSANTWDIPTGTNAPTVNPFTVTNTTTFNNGNLYEFTVGEAPSFATSVFYSRANGNWETNGSWSTVAIGGADCGCTPTNAVGTLVVIGGGNTITMTASGKLVSGVNLQSTGILELGTTSGHSFGNVAGTGTLQYTLAAGSPSLPTYNASSAFFFAGGGTVLYQGNGNYSVPDFQNVCNVTFSSGVIATRTIPGNLIIHGNTNIATAQVTVSTAFDLTIRNDVSNTGALLQSAGTTTFDGENQTDLAFNGPLTFNNVVISPNTFVFSNGSQGINILGNFTNNSEGFGGSGSCLEHTNGSMVFSGATTPVSIGGTGTSQLRIGSMIVNAGKTVNATGEIRVNDDVTINGNFNHTAGTFSTFHFFPAGSTSAIQGSGASCIFHNLTVSGNGAAYEFRRNFIVTNTLLHTDAGGVIDLFFPRTGSGVTVNCKDFVGTGAPQRLNMGFGSPTLTGNVNSNLNISGIYSTSSNYQATWIYGNSGFRAGVTINFSGAGQVINHTGISNPIFQSLNFTGNAPTTVNLTTSGIGMTLRGDLSNNATTPVTFTGAVFTLTLDGGISNFSPQNIGSTGGTFTFNNVIVDHAATTVNLAGRLVVTTGGTPFGLINSSTVNGGSATVAYTFSGGNVSLFPNTGTWNRQTSTVEINVPNGQALYAAPIFFHNLTVNSGNTSGNFQANLSGNLNITSSVGSDGANPSSVGNWIFDGTNQTFSGTGAFYGRNTTINAGSVITSTLATFEPTCESCAGAFTNNGTFTATAGNCRLDNATAFVDSRGTDNSTFFNLEIARAVTLFNANATVSNALNFFLSGSFMYFPSQTGGLARTLIVNDINFNGPANSGIAQLTGGAAPTTSLTHSLTIQGNVNFTQVPTWTTRRVNGGNVIQINTVFNPQGGDKAVNLSTNTINLTNVELASTSAGNLTVTANINLGGNYINNSSSRTFNHISGRLTTVNTTGSLNLTNNAGGTTSWFNFSNATGVTASFVGTHSIAGNATGTTVSNSAWGNAGTLNMGSSIINLTGNITNTTFLLAGTFNAGTGTLNFNSNLGVQRLAWTNGGTLSLYNANITGTVPPLYQQTGTLVVGPGGTFDAGVYSIQNANVLAAGTAAVTINGTFRTANLNGFAGGINAALSTTGATPTVTFGASGTVDYYAPSGNQVVTNVSPSAYGNLIFSGGGTKTTAGSFTINNGNTLTANNGLILDLGASARVTPTSGSITVNLNGITRCGNPAGLQAASLASFGTASVTLNLGANSEVIYNGSSLQTISGTASSYKTLTYTNTAGGVLGGTVQVDNVFNMQGSFINITGANSLTLGTSASNTGTLNYTSGYLNFALGATGNFIRWVGTSGLPTTESSAILYPMGSTSADRILYLFFTSSTALNAGGRIAVRHQNQLGTTNIASPYLDGLGGDQITVNQRSNANWVISTPTTPVLNGGEFIRLRAGMVNSVLVDPPVSTARMVTATGPAPGISVNGTGTISSPVIRRDGLSISDMSNTWYLGSGNVIQMFIAVNASPASWFAPSTWSPGAVPISSGLVIIPATAAEVSVDGAGAVAQELTVEAGGFLNFGTQTVTLSSGGVATLEGQVRTQNTNGLFGGPATSISNTNSPTISFGISGAALYDAAGAQTISAGQYNRLRVKANRGGANLTFSPSGTIFINDSLNVFSTPTPNAAYVTTNSTIEFNRNGNQVITAGPTGFNYFNLSSSGTGTRSFQPSNIRITGTFNPGPNTYDVTGSTLEFTGSGSTPAIPAFNYNNLITSGTGTRTFVNGGTIGVAGTFTTGGGLTNIITGNTFSYNGTGAQTLTAFNYHNLTITSTGRGANVVTFPSGTIGIFNNFSPAAGVIYSNPSGTINFNTTGNNSVVIPGFGGNFQYRNLTISTSLTGANTVTFDPVNEIQIQDIFTPTATPGGAGYVTTSSTIFFSRGSGQQVAAWDNYYNLVCRTANNYNFSSGVIEVRNVFRNQLNDNTAFGFIGIPVGTIRLSSPGTTVLPPMTTYNNLEITGGGIKSARIPFSVVGTLTLNNTILESTTATSGIISIGTSGATPGALSVIGTGGIRLAQANGPALQRWYGTSGLPTNFASQASLFPLLSPSGENRNMWVSFSTATALITEGALRVAYDPSLAGPGITGYNQFSPAVSDGGVNCRRAAHFRWLTTWGTIPTTGVGQSINLRIQASNTFSPANLANSRLLWSGTGAAWSPMSVAGGTSVAGTGTTSDPQGNKTGLGVGDFNSHYWAYAADNSAAIVVANGNWTTNSTWLANAQPSPLDDIIIPSPFNLDVTTNQSCNNIQVNAGASITIPGNNTLTMGTGTTATINGTFLVGNTNGLCRNAFSAISTANAPVISLLGGTVNFTSNLSQFVDNRTYGNLTMSGTGARAINGSAFIEGVFTPSTNPWTTTGSTFVFSGLNGQVIPPLAPGSSYNNISNTSNDRVLGTANPIQIQGNFIVAAGTYTTTGSTVRYNGNTGTQTVADINYDNLEFTGTAINRNWVVSSPRTISGNLIVSGNAQLNISGNSVSTNNSASSIALSGGGINLSGSGSLICNGTLTNTGGTFSPTPNTAGPSFSFPLATSVYIHARNGGNFPKATFGPSSLVQVTGITNTNFSSSINQAYPAFEWNCPSQTAPAGFSPLSGGSKSFGSINVIHSGSSHLAFQTTGSDATATVSGDVTISTNGRISGYNLAGAATGISSLTISGNLVNNGTIELGNAQSGGGSATWDVVVLGNVTNNGNISSQFTNPSSSKISMAGTVSRLFTQTGTFSRGVFEVNKTGGSQVTLAGTGASFPGLNFVSGLLPLSGGQTLTYTGTASASGTSTSYISIPVGTADQFVWSPPVSTPVIRVKFPIGPAGVISAYRPIALENLTTPGSASTVSVQFRNNPGTSPTNATSVRSTGGVQSAQFIVDLNFAGGAWGTGGLAMLSNSGSDYFNGPVSPSNLDIFRAPGVPSSWAFIGSGAIPAVEDGLDAISQNGVSFLPGLNRFILGVSNVTDLGTPGFLSWTGLVSNDWNNPSNWNPSQVPSANYQKLTIPNVLRKPVYTGPGTVAIRGITIQSGSSLSFNNGNLTLDSVFSNSGTFTCTGLFTLAGSNFTLPIPATVFNFGGTNGINNLNGLLVSNSSTSGVVVNASQRFTVIDSVTLAANGRLNLSGAALTLRSTASKTAKVGTIPASAVLSGASNVTVQRFVPSNSQGWYFLGTSVQGQTFSNWTDNFRVNLPFALPGVFQMGPQHTNIFTYDGTASPINGPEPTEVNGWRIPTSGTTNVGSGYRTYLLSSFLLGSKTFDNTGTITQGDFTFSTPYNAAGYGGGGWNFLANPYPAAINWDAPTWTKTNINDAIYVWNGANNQYMSYVAGVGTNGGTNIIPSSQGFFVQNGPGAELTSRESVKFSGSGSFSRVATQGQVLRIKLKDQNGKSDENVLYIHPDASFDFDPQWDAKKLDGGSLNLGILNSDLALSIQAFNQLEETTVFPLRVNTAAQGTFSFQFENLDGFLDGSHTAYLKDNYLGILDLLVEGQEMGIVVNSDPQSQGDGRFEIVFTSNAITSIGKFEKTRIDIFPNPSVGGKIQFLASGLEYDAVGLELKDILGRTLWNQTYSAENRKLSTKIDLPFPAGMYRLSVSQGQKIRTIPLIIK